MKATKGTRETLLANKPKVQALEINGNTYYIRELTVGEVNHALYGQQQEYIRLAKLQGIELDFDDAEALAKQLSRLYDPCKLARTIATRLCDEQGINLFDPENQADLEAISKLDKSVFGELALAMQDNEPKNLQTDASSKLS